MFSKRDIKKAQDRAKENNMLQYHTKTFNLKIGSKLDEYNKKVIKRFVKKSII